MARQEVPWGGEQPTEREQEWLFDATYRYFDRAYVALLHMHSVVSRFYSVFGVHPSAENRTLIGWMETASPTLTHDEIADLERARLFRAMLVHQDQFPPYSWVALSNSTFELIHIALYGRSIKSGRPRGSTRMPPAYRTRGDWMIEAPDEVAATNSLFSGAVDIFFPHCGTPYSGGRISRSVQGARRGPAEAPTTRLGAQVQSQAGLDDRHVPRVKRPPEQGRLRQTKLA